MTERTTGIVLRTYPLTESSLIVHWLTAELGRIATVAKGARRTKSPFRGKLDLFHAGELSIQRNRRSELHTLREFVLAETHQALRQDLCKLRQAAYCAALVEQTSEMDTPVPGLFDLLAGLLRWLPGQAAAARTVFAFELKLLAELGLSAAQQRDTLSSTSRDALGSLERAGWEQLEQIRLEQPDELGQFLNGFLIYHLGKLPRNRAEALSCSEKG